MEVIIHPITLPKEITENNFDQIKLTNTEKVFENNRFIICKIKS